MSNKMNSDTVKRVVMLFLVCVVFACEGQGAELVRLDGVSLVQARWNDGDSFDVMHAGKELKIRLYYVDCPETQAKSPTDARRVREQTRYFGMPSHSRPVHYGGEASAFTRERLREPFVVHTAYATAPGRSSKKRCYAFVTTADGEDLAHLLVKQGYARGHGVRRAMPGGMARDEAEARLSDIEVTAMLDRRGIWSETDSQRLVELRAAARQEAEEFALIKRETSRPQGKVNVNTASTEELQTIRGIGPVTARRIVELRPFRRPEDLTRIPRLSSATRSNLINHVTFEYAREHN